MGILPMIHGHDARATAKEYVNIYPGHNTRYWEASALGQQMEITIVFPRFQHLCIIQYINLNGGLSMFFGVLLLLLGILMLLDRIGVISGPVWDYFWPLALVALGVAMIVRSKRNKIL